MIENDDERRSKELIAAVVEQANAFKGKPMTHADVLAMFLLSTALLYGGYKYGSEEFAMAMRLAIVELMPQCGIMRVPETSGMPS